MATIARDLNMPPGIGHGIGSQAPIRHSTVSHIITVTAVTAQSQHSHRRWIGHDIGLQAPTSTPISTQYAGVRTLIRGCHTESSGKWYSGVCPKRFANNSVVPLPGPHRREAVRLLDVPQPKRSRKDEANEPGGGEGGPKPCQPCTRQIAQAGPQKAVSPP